MWRHTEVGSTRNHTLGGSTPRKISEECPRGSRVALKDYRCLSSAKRFVFMVTCSDYSDNEAVRSRGQDLASTASVFFALLFIKHHLASCFRFSLIVGVHVAWFRRP